MNDKISGGNFKKQGICIASKNRSKNLVIIVVILTYDHKLLIAIAIAKSLQSCPTLCDPIDGSPPGTPVPGILQARTLEWVAICFSNA